MRACPKLSTPCRIAYVGAGEPFTRDDNLDAAAVSVWLVDHGVVLPSEREHDVVNLVSGRDFLAEHRQYDLVILHNLFDPSKPDGMIAVEKIVPEKHASPIHSVAQWRRRLVEAKASYIFVFECRANVFSGAVLGAVPGYDIAAQGDPCLVYDAAQKTDKFTVYVANDAESSGE